MDEQNYQRKIRDKEKNIKELLSSLTQKDFESNTDLHMHSCFSDGKLTPEELVQDASNKGYKLIAIADHNTVEAYKKTPVLNSETPKVITAIEFDCWYKGVLVHILGYGIDVYNTELLTLCAKNKKETEADIVRLLNHRHPKDVIQAIHNAGGIAVLAHPACYWAISLDRFVKSLIKLGLDGIEVFYPYRRHRGIIKFHKASTVKKIGEKYNLILTGGSDSHGAIQPII